MNYWLCLLMPVLRDALGELGILPERDPRAFAQSATPRGGHAAHHRRHRAASPEAEKLQAHSSGRKKMHSDKNVVVAAADRERIDFLSQTYVGRIPDKSIADQEGIACPPGTVLYKDSGFQEYEPAVAETCQGKKRRAAGS